MNEHLNYRQNIKSGLFLSLAIALFVLSIILIGGERTVFSSSYTLKVKLSEVQGLAVGSVVSFVGINVGNVTAMHLNPENHGIDVELNIEKNFQKKITKGSMASVKTQGALGDRYIYISPGPWDAEPLKDGQYLTADNSGDLIDVITREGPKLANIVNVINELNTFFKNLNDNNNSAVFMENMTKSSQELHKFLVEGRQSARQLQSILKKIDQGGGTLGALINDPTVHEQITTILGKNPRNSYLKPLIRATIKATDEKAKK